MRDLNQTSQNLLRSAVSRRTIFRGVGAAGAGAAALGRGTTGGGPGCAAFGTGGPTAGPTHAPGRLPQRLLPDHVRGDRFDPWLTRTGCVGGTGPAPAQRSH